MVIKDKNLVFLSMPNGNVPLHAGHGLGLYYRDCRYLNGYELDIGGQSLIPLVASADHPFSSVFELTNPRIELKDGAVIDRQLLSVEWRRRLHNEDAVLFDTITIHNYGSKTLEFPLRLRFSANFEDVFAVRGLLPVDLGRHFPCEWKRGDLLFLYRGGDEVYRSTRVEFSTQPSRTEDATALYDVQIPPRGCRKMAVSIGLQEANNAFNARSRHRLNFNVKKVQERYEKDYARWAKPKSAIASNSLVLNKVTEHALRDLHMLRSGINGTEYFAAGIPWFSTLFGRDSIITALQTLSTTPNIAAHTLRVLAELQGKKEDDWKDEEPGKILHEFRRGEFARMGEIPHSPYYGTVDATPLFLVLFEQHAAWSGRLDLFKELRQHVDQALLWIDRYGDMDGDGYVEYHSKSRRGLINQGWKDSGNAIVTRAGEIATPPIALVEVQGYVYQAKRGIADLLRRTGDTKTADLLERQAEELRARFNRDFWMRGQQTYALALQGDKSQAAVVSSNAGHALWSGVADREKADKVVSRLMSEDMFSGWGVRTLSTHEKAYNPVGYHLGTVWPHDNSMLAAGFRRYGYDEAAMRIFSGIIEAAMHFEYYRLPEVFSGFPRESFGSPVAYPTACHPQAWASGSIPYLIQTMLGLQPRALDGRLQIVRPRIPEFMGYVELRRLCVGEATLDLRFERVAGRTDVRVLRQSGPLKVEVEISDE